MKRKESQLDIFYKRKNDRAKWWSNNGYLFIVVPLAITMIVALFIALSAISFKVGLSMNEYEIKYIVREVIKDPYK